MSILTTSYDPSSGIYSYKKDGTWFFSTCPPDQIASRRVDGKWYFVELCVGGGGGGDVTKIYVDQQDNKLQANIDKCFADSKDYADSLVADYALISYVDEQIAGIEIPEGGEAFDGDMKGFGGVMEGARRGLAVSTVSRCDGAIEGFDGVIEGATVS